MTNFRIVSWWCLLLPFVACKGYPPLDTVQSIDLQRYAGKWYEAARLPNRFQKHCDCSTAEYALHPDGYVEVVNRCVGTKGARSVTGKAFVVQGSNNTKLRVQFQWPFRGDYWVIDCAQDYSYAVVSEPSRRYLWILSRTEQMHPDTLNAIENRLLKRHFNLSGLVRSKKKCN